MPIFHPHRAVAKRAGVNDVGPSGVKDVCNATDTDLFQGEDFFCLVLSGSETIFFCLFPEIFHCG